MEGNNGEITVFTNNRANENLKAYSEYKGIRGEGREIVKNQISLNASKHIAYGQIMKILVPV